MILDLLKIVTEKYPPGSRRHHITLNTTANLLELGIWIGDKNHNFSIDEEEMRNPILLLSEIEVLLSLGEVS